jgi:hypothetical protein
VRGGWLPRGRGDHRASLHRAPDDVGGRRRRRPRHGRHALWPSGHAYAHARSNYARQRPRRLCAHNVCHLTFAEISANTSVKTIEGHCERHALFLVPCHLA